MISKRKGEFFAECNECGHEEYGGVTEDFHEFLAQLKDEGWKIRKDEDEWQHICPDCQ